MMHTAGWRLDTTVTWQNEMICVLFRDATPWLIYLCPSMLCDTVVMC